MTFPSHCNPRVTAAVGVCTDSAQKRVRPGWRASGDGPLGWTVRGWRATALGSKPTVTSPGLNSSNPIVTQMAPVESCQSQNKTLSHEPGEGTGRDEWVCQGREGGERPCEGKRNPNTLCTYFRLPNDKKRNSRPLVIFNHSSNQSDF